MVITNYREIEKFTLKLVYSRPNNFLDTLNEKGNFTYSHADKKYIHNSFSGAFF
jgi:hypothetical protein